MLQMVFQVILVTNMWKHWSPIFESIPLFKASHTIFRQQMSYPLLRKWVRTMIDKQLKNKYLSQWNFSAYSVLSKCTATHEVIEIFPIAMKSHCSIRHQSCSLGRSMKWVDKVTYDKFGSKILGSIGVPRSHGKQDKYTMDPG